MTCWRLVINLVTAHTDTYVPITLRVLPELFQRLDYHLCHMALRGCWNYFGPTSLGEPCGDKGHFLGYGSGHVRRRSAEECHCN